MAPIRQVWRSVVAFRESSVLSSQISVTSRFLASISDKTCSKRKLNRNRSRKTISVTSSSSKSYTADLQPSQFFQSFGGSR
jgi:hypothetical protein